MFISKLIKMITVVSLVVVSASAYKSGEEYTCVAYKDYDVKSGLSYEYSKKEMQNSKFSFKFLNPRHVIDTSKDEYKYILSNKNGWRIFKNVNADTIFSISPGVNETTGMVTVGIMKNAYSDTITYAVCKRNK